MAERQPTATARRRQGRTILLVMFCCSLVPVLLAWLVFYQGQAWIPAATTNEGTLLRPPIELHKVTGLEDLSGGKWLLLLISDEQCAASCRQALHYMRQVNIALGKDMDRVDRLLLGALSRPEELVELQRDYPKLRFLAVNQTVVATAFRQAGAPAPDTSFIYLVDPLGNIMMYYPPQQFGKPVLEDLRHLLRVSNIG